MSISERIKAQWWAFIAYFFGERCNHVAGISDANAATIARLFDEHEKAMRTLDTRVYNFHMAIQGSFQKQQRQIVEMYDEIGKRFDELQKRAIVYRQVSPTPPRPVAPSREPRTFDFEHRQ